MGLFDRFILPAIGGEIGYYGLGSWWLETFNDADRRELQRAYDQTGMSLATGPVRESCHSSAVKFLSVLGSRYSVRQRVDLATRVFDHAERLADTNATAIERHVLYCARLDFSYYHRDRSSLFFDDAVRCCQQMIQIADAAAAEFRCLANCPPPPHPGFRQLAIIREKQGRFLEAIELCQQAEALRWEGDWRDRTARLQKKAIKAGMLSDSETRMRWTCPSCSKVWTVPHTNGLTVCVECDPAQGDRPRHETGGETVLERSDRLSRARAVALAQLRDLEKHSDFITQVEVLATLDDGSCESCLKADGRNYPLKQALKLMPIPHGANEEGVCRCCWIAVFET